MHTILHAIAGYFYLLLTVRVLRRRPGAQMTPFEFVIIFLIGGIIITTVVGNDRSEVNSICAVLTVALMRRLVSAAAQRFPRIGAVVHGVPLVVLKDGEGQREIMERMRLHETDVVARRPRQRCPEPRRHQIRRPRAERRHQHCSALIPAS